MFSMLLGSCVFSKQDSKLKHSQHRIQKSVLYKGSHTRERLKEPKEADPDDRSSSGECSRRTGIYNKIKVVLSDVFCHTE